MIVNLYLVPDTWRPTLPRMSFLFIRRQTNPLVQQTALQYAARTRKKLFLTKFSAPDLQHGRDLCNALHDDIFITTTIEVGIKSKLYCSWNLFNYNYDRSWHTMSWLYNGF